MKPLVLASSSQIRKEILSKYDVPYICEKPLINEDELKENSTLVDPRQLSYFLAEAKAQSLSTIYPENIILGCDQICIFNNDIFEKPLTVTKAINNLKILSGNTHHLIGSYVFVKNSEVINKYTAICTLTMKNLTAAEIKNYVDELNRELDTAENAVSVLRSQIKVLADILSPDNLKVQYEWQGEIAEKLNQMEKDIITLQHMHNGRHPALEEILTKNKA